MIEEVKQRDENALEIGDDVEPTFERKFKEKITIDHIIKRIQAQRDTLLDRDSDKYLDKLM